MKENYLAIGLGKHDIGETDRLYTFYTLEKGLMRVSAKGVRKPHARLAPHVEDFVVSHITIAQNHGPGTLAGAVTEDGLVCVRDNLDIMFTLMYVRDVFVRVMSGYEKDARVFDLYHDFLRAINEYGESYPERSAVFLAEAFLMKLFGLLGYAFVLQKCVSCHETIIKDAHFFDAHSGGVLCTSCARNKVHVLRVDAHTITFLRLVKRHHFDQLAKVVVTRDVERQMHSITEHVHRWIVR